jgi:ribosome-binding factor A
MGRRPARLGEAIREEVSQMVSYELKDPRLGLVTVTRVEVSPDLGHARVHVGILGSEAERKKSLEALRSAAGFVRRELSQRLGIRQVPEVDFRFDKGLEASERVARLLDEDKATVAAALAESRREDGEAAQVAQADGLPDEQEALREDGPGADETEP